MRTIEGFPNIGASTQAETATLLSKVLWITTVGFIFTAVGAWIAPAQMFGIGFFGIVILNFGLIFAINAASRRSSGLALTLFYAFTFLMGIEIGPLLKMYLRLPDGTGIVFDAAITTALGMAAMALLAEVARFDYRKVSRYAFAALIGLIVVGVVGMFVHFISPGVYAWLSLAVFSVLLLVDFMRLKNSGRDYSPVQLSLSIYLDALNIFLALLQIFSGGSRRRS